VATSSANPEPVLSTSIPTSLARPRYIGYAAMAAARRPKISGKRGRAGSWSKPRSSTMLAGAASVSRWRASATKRLTSSAVRFEHTAAHRVAQRVITEEPEVPGATARCDARCHVAEQSAGGLGGERVEVRQARRFHLRLAGLQVGQPGQAVEGKQDDLRRVGD